MKAVIPAAGLGTRFLPATKSQPKEMLPVVDKPAIQYVVEEAVEAGIRDILIVTGRSKRAIEDHFDRALELEHLLEQRGERERLAEVRRIADLADVHFVRQREPRGLGDAILCARRFVGQEPFALLLGDDIFRGAMPCIAQLMAVHRREGAGVMAVERVPRERLSSYGVIAPGAQRDPKTWEVRDVVEKPRPQDAPSDLAVAGRYVLPPSIFPALEQAQPVKGEILLADGFRGLLQQGETLLGHAFDGKRWDTGSKLGWLLANVEEGLDRKEFREPLAAALRAMLDPR
jgi:UTP--glucose-1-phosphate uridylyltransferase